VFAEASIASEGSSSSDDSEDEDPAASRQVYAPIESEHHITYNEYQSSKYAPGMLELQAQTGVNVQRQRGIEHTGAGSGVDSAVRSSQDAARPLQRERSVDMEDSHDDQEDGRCDISMSDCVTQGSTSDWDDVCL
jgi:hypothetical protein